MISMAVQNKIKKNRILDGNKVPGSDKTDKKIRKKKLIKWVFILFVFLSELLVYTGARVACTNSEYRITMAKKRQKKIKAYHAELLLEKARLTSPVRIFKIAGTRLNLVMPGHDMIVYMDMEK